MSESEESKNYGLSDSRHVRLLEWLLTPERDRVPASQAALARELGVTERSLRWWKNDPKFRAVWDKQMKTLIGDPTRLQRLFDMLYDGALNQDESLSSRTRAAEVFFRHVAAITPPEINDAKRKAAEMSDDELRALLAQAAQQELAARR